MRFVVPTILFGTHAFPLGQASAPLTDLEPLREVFVRDLYIKSHMEQPSMTNYPVTNLFQPNSVGVRQEVAKIVGLDNLEETEDLWEQLHTQAFLFRTTWSTDQDLLKAGALLMSEFVDRDLYMKEYNLHYLCTRIVKEEKLYLRDFEFEYAREHLIESDLALRKARTMFFTPFANFNKLKCPYPLPLKFRTKILREQVVRLLGVSKGPLTENLPLKVAVTENYPDMVKFLVNFPQNDLVPRFAVRYADTQVDGPSALRNWLGVFFNHARSKIEAIEVQLFVSKIEGEYTALGRAIGLGIIFNIPVGYLVDLDFLTPLVSGEEASNTGDEGIELIRKGFNEIIPKGVISSLIHSGEELSAILLGSERADIPIQAVKDSIVVVTPLEANSPLSVTLPPAQLTKGQKLLLIQLYIYLEDKKRVTDFVRIVTGQHRAPFATWRRCREIQIEFVPPSWCENQVPTARMTYNKFFLPELRDKDTMYAKLDLFFEKYSDSLM